MKISKEDRGKILDELYKAYENRQRDDVAEEAFEQYVYERRGYRQAKYDLEGILNSLTAEDVVFEDTLRGTGWLPKSQALTAEDENDCGCGQCLYCLDRGLDRLPR